MFRILPLLLVLAACGSDAGPKRKAKPVGAVQDAQRLRVDMEIRQLATEAEQYHVLRGEWPETWQAIRRSGRDPWGNEYVLEIDGERAVVCSAGPDGEPGTDDDLYGGAR